MRSTGTFIHYVLEHALDVLGKCEGGAAHADQPTVRKACREAVRQYVAEELGGMENKTARFQYLFRRLVRAVEQILDNVIEELRVSDFAPIDYELDFRAAATCRPCSVRTAMCRFHSPARWTAWTATSKRPPLSARYGL